MNVQNVARKMVKSNIGALLVTNGTKLVGIVTERDIIAKVMAEGKDPQTVKVCEIMTEEVIMVGPNQDIEDAADVMTEKKIKKLPVVSGGQLVGIITATDIVAAEPAMLEKMSALLFFAKTKKPVAG
jgi:CBS domain-containing protein